MVLLFHVMIIRVWSVLVREAAIIAPATGMKKLMCAEYAGERENALIVRGQEGYSRTSAMNLTTGAENADLTIQAEDVPK